MILKFPSVENADPISGLLAVGGDLEVGSLEMAYRNGIFPWPVEDEPLLWFAPAKRAILEFKDLRVSSRLQRYLNKSNFEFKINHDFAAVINGCATSKNRRKQKGTWITEEMIQAYIEFHQAGFAQSFETYNFDGRLMGGLYGVLINKYFAGESMFYLESHASKFALIKAIQHLKSMGLTWIDIQMLTPLLKNFRAKEIPRSEFMEKLRQAVTK